jgi:hypothetical protein
VELIGIASAFFGTMVGCFLSWILANRSARKQTRKDALINTWHDLDALRISYSEWYIQHEYASLNLRGTSPLGDIRGPKAIETEQRLDQTKTAIRFDLTSISAQFPRGVSAELRLHLERALHITTRKPSASMEEVVEIVQKAQQMIHGYLTRYAK